MFPPNFPRLDYFDIFKKCRGLGAAVESAYSCGEEDFTREVQRIFRLADELFETSTDNSILKAM
jgi:hypothetical protein